MNNHTQCRMHACKATYIYTTVHMLVTFGRAIHNAAI